MRSTKKEISCTQIRLTLHGDDQTRFIVLANGFNGELDELRIWNVLRTREDICDAMDARLSDVLTEVAVYLPFDAPDAESTAARRAGLLIDASNNFWHMTPLNGTETLEGSSDAPVGYGASCVNHSPARSRREVSRQRCAAR